MRKPGRSLQGRLHHHESRSSWPTLVLVAFLLLLVAPSFQNATPHLRLCEPRFETPMKSTLSSLQILQWVRRRSEKEKEENVWLVEEKKNGEGKCLDKEKIWTMDEKKNWKGRRGKYLKKLLLLTLVHGFYPSLWIQKPICGLKRKCIFHNFRNWACPHKSLFPIDY